MRTPEHSGRSFESWSACRPLTTDLASVQVGAFAINILANARNCNKTVTQLDRKSGDTNWVRQPYHNNDCVVFASFVKRIDSFLLACPFCASEDDFFLLNETKVSTFGVAPHQRRRYSPPRHEMILPRIAHMNSAI
jgi:hypothetical protein